MPFVSEIPEHIRQLPEPIREAHLDVKAVLHSMMAVTTACSEWIVDDSTIYSGPKFKKTPFERYLKDTLDLQPELQARIDRAEASLKGAVLNAIYSIVAPGADCVHSAVLSRARTVNLLLLQPVSCAETKNYSARDRFLDLVYGIGRHEEAESSLRRILEIEAVQAAEKWCAGEAVRWSPILNTDQIAAIFGHHWKTVKGWFKDGRIKNQELSTKAYLVDLSAMPIDWEEKAYPARNQTEPNGTK